MSEDQTPPMARPRVAAGALFFDDEGRVLLVKPTYKVGWDIPGGYVEPSETPVEACRREVNEELGLDPWIGQLLVVDWAPSEAEGDKVLFVFDCGIMTEDSAARIVLPADELSASAFHDPDVLDELMIDRLARRVSVAIQARRHGRTTYLEHGS